MQLDSIAGVCDCALSEAGLTLKDIGLIAVTNGPGLAGSLNVGVNFAKSVSFSAGYTVDRGEPSARTYLRELPFASRN